MNHKKINRPASHSPWTAPATRVSERLQLVPAGSVSDPVWLVQEKMSGCLLATVSRQSHRSPAGFVCVQRHDPWAHSDALAEAIELLDATPPMQHQTQKQIPEATLSQKKACHLWADLGIGPATVKAPLVPESCRLQHGGSDCFGRPFFLHPLALAAWNRMQQAAAADGISLSVVSAFRSFAYQAGLIQRKRCAGLQLSDILRVNAVPGTSEHHSGMALDLHCPDEPGAPAPLDETFEHTRAFAWLSTHGSEHGFSLSYPRDNPHGMIYEPWHWCYKGSAD